MKYAFDRNSFIMIEWKLYRHNSFHSIIMKPSIFSSNTVKALLKQNKVATMGELKSALKTRAPITVIRKLSELGYLTSYTHGGRYYTLESTPKFNEYGLWSNQSVWFSIHGTLLNTLVQCINKAEDGFLGDELKILLHVNVNPSLLKLFNQGKVSRTKYQGRYLYCAVEPTKKKCQIATRQANTSNQGTRAIVMGDDWVSDEIKAAIIIFFSLLDEKQRRLFAGLESLQFGHGGDSWIAQLLTIDPHTVSKGRRQLIERDIDSQEIRASGAGRPNVKKNT